MLKSFEKQLTPGTIMHLLQPNKIPNPIAITQLNNYKNNISKTFEFGGRG